MIPTTIKDLFKFIDFLHANIDNFNQNNELLNDLRNLAKQRSEVKKVGSFKDRLEYEKIQKEIKHKFEKLQKQVNIKITAKAKQYNIIDNTQSLNVILSYNGLQQLKDNATIEDLETINEKKYKYLTYRLKTNKENYLVFEMFFNDLDRYLFELFDYFSEDKNELEILQNETLRSDTIKEACLYFSKGVYPRATIRIILDSVLSKIRIRKHANKPINFESLKTSIIEAFTMAEKLQPVLTDTEKKEFLDYLSKWISKTQSEVKSTKDKAYLAELLKANEVEDNKKAKVKTVPSFDPNQFNEDGAKLFEYLVENYIDLEKKHGLQKRFTNVWHFMKNDNQKKDTYKFYFTKDEYKAYVFKRYNLVITNTDKSEYKYPEVDLIQLKDHVLAFEDLYKS